MPFETLLNLLYNTLDWRRERILVFFNLILGVIKERTVTISKLACHMESNGQLQAKIAKIERFYREQQINFFMLGKIIIMIIANGCSDVKFNIAIDRTNWKFGNKNINILVAAIIFDKISIPISWVLLDKQGNSNSNERIELIKNILKIISVPQIQNIFADREFIGEKWFKYLSINSLPFCIRIKKNEVIKSINGGKIKISKYCKNMNPGECKSVNTKIYGNIAVNITILKIEKDFVIIASNNLIAQDALISYKQRWGIERTFKSLKTDGFNIEDTHMTDLNKLRKLFGVLTIALLICTIGGEIKNKAFPIKIKKHGYPAYSLFNYGMIWIKSYLQSQNDQSIIPVYEELISRLNGALCGLLIESVG